MLDVLLVNPNQSFYKGQLKRVGMPVGLLQMAAVLQQGGFKVDVLDAALEGYDHEWLTDRRSSIDNAQVSMFGLDMAEIVQFIAENDPKVIGIGNFASSQHQNTLHLAEVIKNYFPTLKIVVGGPHFTYDYEAALKTGNVDVVVRGEGDLTLLELVKAFGSANALSSVSGIAFNDSGKIVATEARAFLQDLDELPFPAYELVEKYKYGGGKAHFGMSKHEKIAEFFTSRGCPIACDFCYAVPMHGRKYRKNSLGYIEAHLDHLMRWGYEEVIMEDDNLLVDKERAKKIIKSIAKRNLAWTEIGGINITQLLTKDRSDVDKEMIDQLKESGCYRIYLAIESDDPNILRKHGKGVYSFDRDVAVRVAGYLNKAGIEAFGGFMIGFPEQSVHEIRATLDYAKMLRENGLDYAILFNATPIPGTAFYKAQASNIVGIAEDFVYERANYNTPSFSAEQFNALYDIFMEYVNGPDHKTWKKTGVWPGRKS